MARYPRQFARMGAAVDLPDMAAILAYVGPNGEPIFDGNTLRMQDGFTPGGIPLLRRDEAPDPKAALAYPTRAEATASQVPAIAQVIKLAGYSAAGDGGDAYYARLNVAPLPVKPWHFQSADGAWWVLAGSVVNVLMFGAVRGPGANEAVNNVALQNARDYIASYELGTGRPALKFPAGIYVYNVSPNWAITNAHIFAEGDVRLRYTGTDKAVIIDAGGDGTVTNCMQMRMGRFVVEATAGTGVIVRAVHHSEFEFDVRGCGPDSPALDLYAAVCTMFRRFTVSKWAGLTGDWYMGAQPGYGVRLDRRPGNPIDTEPVSYCVFDTPIIEHTKTGAYLINALGCIFENGTIEGCTVQGAQISATSNRNIFRHVDFEANANHDISCGGHDNWVINCDTDNIVSLNATALRCRVQGGQHKSIAVFEGAQNCFVQDLMYAYGGGALIDSGTTTTFKNLVSATTGERHDAPRKRTAVTPTGSPFTYANISGNEQEILVAGGTVSGIVLNFAGGGDGTGVIQGLFRLRPGASLTIHYSVAPTIVVYQG